MNIKNLIQYIYDFIKENKYNLIILIVILIVYYYLWYNSNKSTGLKKIALNGIITNKNEGFADINLKDLEEDNIIFALEFYNIEPNKEKGETYETGKFIAIQHKNSKCDNVLYKDYIDVPGLNQKFLKQEATHMNNQLIIKKTDPKLLDMSIFFSIVPRKIENKDLSPELKKELNSENQNKVILEDKIIKSAFSTPYIITISNSIDTKKGTIKNNYGQLIYSTSRDIINGASISMNDIGNHGIAPDGSPIISLMMKGYRRENNLQYVNKDSNGKDIKYVMGECCNNNNNTNICYIPKCTFNKSAVNNPRVCASGTNLTFKLHKYAIIFLSRKNGEELQFKTIYTPIKFRDILKTLDTDELPITVIELVNNILIEKNNLMKSIEMTKSGDYCYELSYFPHDDDKNITTIKFEHDKFTMELVKDKHGNLENKFILCDKSKLINIDEEIDTTKVSEIDTPKVSEIDIPKVPEIEPPSGEAQEEPLDPNQKNTNMVEGFDPNSGNYAKITRSYKSSYGYF